MRALPRTVYCVCKANYVLVTHWSDVGAHFPSWEVETVFLRPLLSPQNIAAKEIPKENLSHVKDCPDLTIEAGFLSLIWKWQMSNEG